MYPVTEAVAALFDANQPQVLRITGTDPNGVSINITEANVMSGGFSIDRYCNNGAKLELGTAVSAELTLKLNNADGTFDGIMFEGAELFVEVGIAEQDLVGISAGLAKCGKKPYAASPASFLSTRSYEQAKVDCAYSGTNVKLIGISGGVSYGALGMSHHSAQDIAAIQRHIETANQ